MNRRLLAALSLSAILLTGCSNVSTESKPSSTATPTSSNAIESGIALQEKANKAADILKVDPLAETKIP